MSAAKANARLVYARTDAGDLECSARSIDIGQSSRRILALVDGQRCVGDLSQFARPGELDPILAELERHRLIDVVSVAREPSEAERRARQLAEQSLLTAAKRTLNGVFRRELGNAGEIWEARIADCVSMEVLRRVLRESVDVVNDRKGEQSARRILAEVRPVFESARVGSTRFEGGAS